MDLDGMDVFQEMTKMIGWKYAWITKWRLWDVEVDKGNQEWGCAKTVGPDG